MPKEKRWKSWILVLSQLGDSALDRMLVGRRRDITRLDSARGLGANQCAGAFHILDTQHAN
jgi:hypothetical protein